MPNTVYPAALCRCFSCRAPMHEPRLCDDCTAAILGTEKYLNRPFDTSLVCRDGAAWFVFMVHGDGPAGLRKLRLLAKCDAENAADRAAREAIGNPSLEMEAAT